MNEYRVDAFWDDEASVWVATSEDVPGLATEAETVDALIEKLRIMIPELIESSRAEPGTPIPFRLHMERSDVARAA